MGPEAELIFIKRFSFFIFFPHRNDTGVFVSDVVSCNVH